MTSQIPVKILTYNTFLRDQAPGLGMQNGERARLIANLIARSDYDVVVFQEAFDDGPRNEIIQILRNQGNFQYRTWVVGFSDEFDLFSNSVGSTIATIVALPFTLGIGIGTGNLPKSDGGIFIMSRWPIVYQGQIVYRDAVKMWEDERAKKGVSWALINKQGLYFNVFGTHTQAGGPPASVRPWGSPDPVAARRKQLAELRGMIDKVGLYWQPALIAGDLNVDYCFEADRLRNLCTTAERDEMFRQLNAAPPQDRARYVYTSDPANELKPDGDKPTTLDYVLVSNTHRAPVHSSLATVKLQNRWTALIGRPQVTQERLDLSDHYGVAASFTFAQKREDSLRFTGEWKGVLLNGGPDNASRLMFAPFGMSITGNIGGQPLNGRIRELYPDADGNKGKVVFETPRGREQYDYSFNKNRSYEQYFIPGERLFERRPPPLNELVLRGQGRTVALAFEGRLPIEAPDIPDRP